MTSLGPRDAAAWRREGLRGPPVAAPRRPRPLVVVLVLRLWRAVRGRRM